MYNLNFQTKNKKKVLESKESPDNTAQAKNEKTPIVKPKLVNEVKQDQTKKKTPE